LIPIPSALFRRFLVLLVLVLRSGFAVLVLLGWAGQEDCPFPPHTAHPHTTFPFPTATCTSNLLIHPYHLLNGRTVRGRCFTCANSATATLTYALSLHVSPAAWRVRILAPEITHAPGYTHRSVLFGSLHLCWHFTAYHGSSRLTPLLHGISPVALDRVDRYGLSASLPYTHFPTATPSCGIFAPHHICVFWFTSVFHISRCGGSLGYGRRTWVGSA